MKNPHEATAAETPYQIIAHISQLMDEAEAMLVGPLVPAAERNDGELRSRIESARAKLIDLSNRTITQLADGAEAADDAIRTHPYKSLGVALGVGLFIGACLGRGSR